MNRTVHRGGQGRPGGGGLPRRRARVPRSPSSTPRRPPASRNSRRKCTCPPRPRRRSRRCAGPSATAGLLQEDDLPPGQHFIDGAFRPGRSGTSIDVVDPSSERTITQVAEGTVEDTDAAVAAAVRREARVGPVDAQGALRAPAPGRRPGRRERRPARPAGVGQHRQAVSGRAGRRGPDHRHVPLHGRRTAGADLGGGGPLRRGPPVGHPARAAGRHRGRDPVELPAADGRLEDGAHPGRRQHAGHQAVGADPAHHAEVRRARGRHPAGRRGQRRDRLRPRGRCPARRAPRRRHDRAHRLGPQRQGGGPAPRPSRSSASTWSWAARPRWSSSPTPTCRPRRPRCAPRATGTRARSAAPPAACWCTSPWPTSSPSCSSTRSRRWSSASPAPATTSRSDR